MPAPCGSVGKGGAFQAVELAAPGVWELRVRTHARTHARRRRVVQILQTDAPPTGNIWTSIQILQYGLGALERAVSGAVLSLPLSSLLLTPITRSSSFSCLSSLALRPAMLWLPPSYRPNNPYARPHHTCSLQLIRARLILDSLTGGHSVTEPRRQLVGGLC